jgi:hypothetical protein
MDSLDELAPMVAEAFNRYEPMTVAQDPRAPASRIKANPPITSSAESASRRGSSGRPQESPKGTRSKRWAALSVAANKQIRAFLKESLIARKSLQETGRRPPYHSS